MLKLLKILLAIFHFVLLIFVIHLNINQYYEPKSIRHNGGVLDGEILNQLNYLKNKIHEGEADKMQEFFPEGFVFFNAVYCLTWIEFAQKLDKNDLLFEEASDEIEWAIKEVNSDKAKETFEQNLPLEYGAFYQGWSTLILAEKLSLLKSKGLTLVDEDEYLWKCEQIATALNESPFSYLQSYSSGTWQADNLICVVALVKHDKLFSPKYTQTIKNWIDKVRRDLHSNTGLISHSDNKRNPRGSSQSLINVFLPQIDTVFAKEVFEKYKLNFLDKRLGLIGVREYPKGMEGVGDVDSGPVIWDIGGVASIVGIKAMAVNKEYGIAKSLRNNIEGLSCPISTKNGKSYFFNCFAMADAFIAWANVTSIDNKVIDSDTNNKILFHFISLFLIFLISGIIYALLRKIINP